MDPDMIIQALEYCMNPKLAIAIHLSFTCSLRLGEILGLRWKDVVISNNNIANDDAHIFVTCELEQVSTKALEVLNDKDVIFTFPPRSPHRSYQTTIVLKKPKTESNIRKIWLSKTLTLMLRDWKKNKKI